MILSVLFEFILHVNYYQNKVCYSVTRHHIQITASVPPMGSGQSTERASSGAETTQRAPDDDVFTEDSDPDSEDTVDLYSDEEIEEEDPEEQEYQRCE